MGRLRRVGSLQLAGGTRHRGRSPCADCKLRTAFRPASPTGSPHPSAPARPEPLVHRHPGHPDDLAVGLDHRERVAQRARDLAVGEEVLERLACRRGRPGACGRRRARRARSARAPSRSAASVTSPPARARASQLPVAEARAARHRELDRVAAPAASGARREAQRAVLRHRAQPAAEVERLRLPRSPSARISSSSARGERTAAAPAREPAQHEPRARPAAARAGPRATPRARRRAPPAPRRPRRPAPPPRRAAGAPVSAIVRSAAGLSSRSASSTSWRTRARAKRRSTFEGSSRHSSPRARQVVAHLLARHLRAAAAPAARAAAPSRAAPATPGRHGQAVEHGLGLVGGGVRRRRSRPSASRSASA